MCAEYYQTVFKYLLCITGGEYDLTQELTQETFLRAIQKAPGFRGECKMSTWLCQIAKFTFYQHLDKKKRHNEVDFEKMPELEAESFPEKEFFEKQRKIELYRAIQRQREPYREVLLLRLTGDLSFQDIGEILGKSENWAKVTFYRAKQMLVKELEEGDNV